VPATRQLTVRYQRRADILMASLYLACSLTCAPSSDRRETTC